MGTSTKPDPRGFTEWEHDPDELDRRWRRPLEAHCREHLAPYKVPTRFVEVTSIPRNEVGKVLTAELGTRATGETR